MNEFVLSNYAKILKRYYSTCISNEELLNDLFFSISGPIDLKNKKNKEPYTVSKGNASDLMNRKVSVPVDIKKESLKISLTEIENYFIDIFKKTDSSKTSELITDIKALYSNKKDVNYNPVLQAFFDECSIIPNKFLARTFIQCLQNENSLFVKNIVLDRGNGKLIVDTGDIIELAFDSNINCEEKIIVIPVDADFTMKVDDLNDKENKLISPNSIHGQRINKSKEYSNNIEESINSYIKKHKILKVIGSIIPYKINNTMFYLLAISKLDKNNNAHSSEDELKKAIISLINYYDKNGQGYPMYMPLLGTGLSRVGLTNKNSLALIKKICRENKEKINGEITIVIYKKDIKN